MSTSVIRNFLNFISRVRHSSKPVPRQLHCQKLCAHNYWIQSKEYFLLTSVDNLLPSMVDQIRYKDTKPMEKWRVPLIKEVIYMK